MYDVIPIYDVSPKSRAHKTARWRFQSASISLGFLFWLFALTSSGLAGEAPRVEWGLSELVARAMEQNAGFSAERMGITVAEEEVSAAKGERLPSLDAVALGEAFPQNERLLIFRHGFRGADNPFQNYIVNYGVEARLPVFTSGRIRHGIRAAKESLNAAEWRVQEAGHILVFNVSSAFYTALELQDVIAAQESTLTSLNESLRITKLKRDVGRVAQLDLYRIETRASQAERDLISARNAYEGVVEIIRELTNLDPGTPISLAGELRRAEPVEESVDILRSLALSMRPELVSLEHEYRSRKESAAAAKSRLGPSIYIAGGYNGVTGIDDGITRDDARIMAQFRLPLYSGGVLQANVRKARAQASQADFRLRDAKRRVLAQVERAFLDLESAQFQIEAANREVSQAAESLRVERINFSRGRGTSNDLLLAEEALLDAQTELAAALAESQIAQAALNLAIGKPPVSVAEVVEQDNGVVE